VMNKAGGNFASNVIGWMKIKWRIEP